MQPRLRGRTFMLRYADDALLAFSSEHDARRVFDVLPKRFERFGLRLHPGKTRIVSFRKPPRSPPSDVDRGEMKPGTFELLGFTHYWGRSRRGYWVVKRKTGSKRLTRAIRQIAHWCRDHRHDPIAQQHAMLCRKVRGHYAYFGVTGNSRSLSCFVRQVERRWRFWLHRRSGRSKMNWDRFRGLLKRLPLPPPKIVHSYIRAARL